MKQNTLVVSLINTKEKLHTFYQNRYKIVTPILKGLMAFATLFFIMQMFPYYTKINHTWIIGGISLVLAFVPVSFFYYVVTGFILANLWAASFDICLAFFAFSFIIAVCYFRMDNKYSYLAVLVPVLFYLKLGCLVPAVLAFAVSFHALVPTAAGIVTYYASMAIKESVSLMNAGNQTSEEMGLMKLVDIMMKNHTFHIVLLAACITILVTSAIYKLFHENAWLMSAFVGNILMAFILIAGSLYWKIEVILWLVLAEMVVGVILCTILELFRGIGDVTRIEKTTFEDDEYIYYVKAVPKIKVTQSDRNVKIMNESLKDDEEMGDIIDEDMIDSDEDVVMNTEETDAQENEEMESTDLASADAETENDENDTMKDGEE